MDTRIRARGRSSNARDLFRGRFRAARFIASANHRKKPVEKSGEKKNTLCYSKRNKNLSNSRAVAIAPPCLRPGVFDTFRGDRIV